MPQIRHDLISALEIGTPHNNSTKQHRRYYYTVHSCQLPVGGLQYSTGVLVLYIILSYIILIVFERLVPCPSIILRNTEELRVHVHTWYLVLWLYS